MINERLTALVGMKDKVEDIYDETQKQHRIDRDLSAQMARKSGISGLPGTGMPLLAPKSRNLIARRNQLIAEIDRLTNLNDTLKNLQEANFPNYVPSEEDKTRFGAALRAEGVGHYRQERGWGQEGVDWDWIQEDE